LAGGPQEVIFDVFMTWTSQCVAVIPCYDEAFSFGAIIAEVRA
jgi:hypothetical protein